MTDEELARQGIDAKAVLESEAYQAGIETLRETLYAEWQRAEDKDTRETLWHMQRVCDLFHDTLSMFVHNGAIAEADLKNLRGNVESFKY